MTTVTIAICTHDRADVLPQAVRAAHIQAVAEDAEVLVIDNASRDATPRVLAGLEAELGPPLRVTHEPTLGLSVARNRALADARSSVVAYLDDDAIPRPGWLAALLAAHRGPQVACAGGPIVLRFPDTRPAWLPPALDGAYSAFDLGREPRRLRYRHDDYPYGANISFRVDAARRAGGFSHWVGPRGRLALVHDETDLCYRLEQAGGEIRYAPDAVVEHQVLPERLTLDWLLRRHALGGRSAAAFILRNRPVPSALYRIVWRYGRALLTLPYRAQEPVDTDRLIAECRRREALGYLRGLLEHLPRLGRLRRTVPV